MNEFVTVCDIAIDMGAKEDESGGINGAEFDRLGLPMFGGCKGCGESLGAFNAFPTQSGYLACRACVGDSGFYSVAEFHAWEKALEAGEEEDNAESECQERYHDWREAMADCGPDSREQRECRETWLAARKRGEEASIAALVLLEEWQYMRREAKAARVAARKEAEKNEK